VEGDDGEKAHAKDVKIQMANGKMQNGKMAKH
jgi:hypothetical protein